MSTDAQVKQLDADLELFAQLVAFDPKYGECAMRGAHEFHTMVQAMRFRDGTYWRDRVLLEADRLKRLRLVEEANKPRAPFREFCEKRKAALLAPRL